MALNKHYVERTTAGPRLVLQRWDGVRLRASVKVVDPAVLRDRPAMASAWRRLRAVNRVVH